MGHSMGGGIMLSFLRMNPDLVLSGVICTNPFLDFPENQHVHTMEKFIVRNLHKRLLVN